VRFVRHARGTCERRPRIEVTRVVQVELIANEIEPAVLVEGRSVTAADCRHPLLAQRTGNMLVHRSCGRRKEILCGLTMKVHCNLRFPAQHRTHDRLDLGLRTRHYVAVHVEPVVIEAALDAPGLAMLECREVRISHGYGVVPYGEPFMAVRIRAGVD